MNCAGLCMVSDCPNKSKCEEGQKWIMGCLYNKQNSEDNTVVTDKKEGDL